MIYLGFEGGRQNYDFTKITIDFETLDFRG